ncbi:hypothetical protein ABNQ39_20885 [Azospirillum sp. A26]|uniref:hypothetical protein n=1 Tax=Azospirillum sp. A26 TaxID=3160607 RepID=UPI00366EF974
MTDKFTKGPHRFTPFTGADGREGYAILSDNPEVGRGYGVMWVAAEEFPNAKHDGPLFAAAPSLLEALEKTLDAYIGASKDFMTVDAKMEGHELAKFMDDDAIVVQARAAIASARGEG